ncbi:SIP domain-containing protein [Tsukamurella ocularis]|uniref:SIP domain-containing protein n=1 Tax=Tsukamurella ocularis TaxID=1970234 RepID=UPI0039EE5920
MASTLRDGAVFPICLREFDVLRVSDVTPGMRRIVVGGDAIGSHVRDGVDLPPVHSTGFDDDVKVLLPDLRTGEFPFEVPKNTDQGRVDWTDGSFEHARTYTVREFDADAGEMTLDFVLHGTGLAATWARRVEVGSKVLIAGPKHSAALPRDVDWLLLAGDETALPAIGRCVEMLPAGFRATAVIEVAEPGHRQDLATDGDVEFIWLYRSEAGGASRLVDAVQGAAWRGERPFLWVAGETLAIKPLRRWAKNEKGLEKNRVEITGYWRHREVATVDGDAELVDTSQDENVLSEIHELTELLPPFAVRAAVTLGLFAAIDDGAATPAAIAAACDTEARATEKLLRHLALLGFVARTGDGYTLTARGELLTDPDEMLAGGLHHAQVRTRLDMSFVHLVEAVRTGTAVPFEGGDLRSARAADPHLAEQLHAAASRWATYRAPALPEAVDFDGVRTVAVFGDGSGVYADNLARLLPEVAVAIVGMPSVVEREIAVVAPERRDRVTAAPGTVFAPLPQRYDLVVGIDVLQTLPDADAELLVTTLRGSADRVVFVGNVLDPATTDDHETEDDLRNLCLYGGGLRTADELGALAGGGAHRIAPLGWGTFVVEYAGA